MDVNLLVCDKKLLYKFIRLLTGVHNCLHVEFLHYFMLLAPSEEIQREHYTGVWLCRCNGGVGGIGVMGSGERGCVGVMEVPLV